MVLGVGGIEMKYIKPPRREGPMDLERDYLLNLLPQIILLDVRDSDVNKNPDLNYK